MKFRYRFIPICVALLLAFLTGCATTGDHDGYDDDTNHDERVELQDETPLDVLPPGDLPPSASRFYVQSMELWDNPELAIRLLSEAIEIDPEFALAYFERANRLKHLGDPEGALRDFTRAIELEPGFVQAWLQRGFLRMWELGDEAGAEDVARAYDMAPNDLEAALAFVGLIGWDEPDHAFEILERLIHEYPDNPEPLIRRAKFRRDMGDYAGAAEDFALAAERSPYDPWARVERAMVLLAMGDFAEARQDVETAAELDPHHPDVLLARARLSVLADNTRAAEELYAEYMGAEWIHQPAKLEAALVIAARGDRELAEDAIRAFQDVEDDPLRARLTRACAEALVGEDERAVDHALEVVREAEWYMPAWLVLAALSGQGVDMPGEVEEEAALRFGEMRGDLPRLFMEHTELLIWLSLYGVSPPEMGNG